jgi:hypothetical protein
VDVKSGQNVRGRRNAAKIVHGPEIWTKRPESHTAIMGSRSISIWIDMIEQVTSEIMSNVIIT